MSKSKEPTTPEEYAEQEEAKRQALIAEDVALHAETDEPSPYPDTRTNESKKSKK